MKFFPLILLLSFVLFTSGFAQEEQLLGKSKTEAIAELSGSSSQILNGKEYPLIKETVRVEGVQSRNAVATVYLFIDSSDKVCRLHLVYDNLRPAERQKIVDDLRARAKSKQDVTDKKHITYIGRTQAADYIFTWAQDKDHASTYLLVTANDYKQRMLNYLVNGGSLPADGIFTPAPSK